jgi:GrpB-like predicted nucleotidyltransferase (UPF0157 family)
MSAQAATSRVVPYDPEWPALFERERARLEATLAPWLAGGIHHIGSTSVPGLTAKPIIDMVAGVRNLDEARYAFEALTRLGYEHGPHRPEAHRFAKPGYHLHLTEPGSDIWRERLAFREALRADADLRREYTEWKLARTGTEAYVSSEKRPLVLRVLGEVGIELKPDRERLSFTPEGAGHQEAND